MPSAFGPKRPAAKSAQVAPERLLHARDGDVALFWTAEDPKRRGLGTVSTPRQALEFLKATRDPAATAAVLQRFYKTRWSTALDATPADARKRFFDLVFGAAQLKAADLEELLGIAAGHLASDRLRVERVVVASGGSGRTAKEPEKAAPVMASSTRTKLVSIAIELVDEDDHPVPGEEYEIHLPDGGVRKGSLDDEGKAEERGLEPGTCKVKFPRLDKDAWEFVRSEPL